ncbi:MAG: hypothetical protein Q9218_005524 [Villophora microphyllina]
MHFVLLASPSSKQHRILTRMTYFKLLLISLLASLCSASITKLKFGNNSHPHWFYTDTSASLKTPSGEEGPHLHNFALVPVFDSLPSSWRPVNSSYITDLCNLTLSKLQTSKSLTNHLPYFAVGPEGKTKAYDTNTRLVAQEIFIEPDLTAPLHGFEIAAAVDILRVAETGTENAYLMFYYKEDPFDITRVVGIIMIESDLLAPSVFAAGSSLATNSVLRDGRMRDA